MAEKLKVAAPVKTPSMTMFGDWMVEKASPTCVPRLCTLQISRLTILRSLDSELQSVYIAVKMDGSRHSLRTSEIVLAANEQELEVCFSLQYSHSLKRDNLLQLFVQRKKRLRYKNSRLPGYKTVACGTINMTSVLQRALDARELDLFAVPSAIAKNGQLEPLGHSPVAQLNVTCSSLPLLDRFAIGASATRSGVKSGNAGRGGGGVGVVASGVGGAGREAPEPSDVEVDDANLSADADAAQFSGDADADAASDRDRMDEHDSADDMQMDALAQAKTLKYIMELPVSASAQEHRRRQNLKQRLRSQLQKMMRGVMRPGDDDDQNGSGSGSTRGKKAKKGGSKQNIVDDELLEAALAAAQSQEEQNRLFDELSELNLSTVDSDVSDDAESIRSTAKPTLRPFFTSKATSDDTLHNGSAAVPTGHGHGPPPPAPAPAPPAHAHAPQQPQQKRTSTTLPSGAGAIGANEPFRECITPPLAPSTGTVFGLDQYQHYQLTTTSESDEPANATDEKDFEVDRRARISPVLRPRLPSANNNEPADKENTAAASRNKRYSLDQCNCSAHVGVGVGVGTAVAHGKEDKMQRMSSSPNPNRARFSQLLSLQKRSRSAREKPNSRRPHPNAAGTTRALRQNELMRFPSDRIRDSEVAHSTGDHYSVPTSPTAAGGGGQQQQQQQQQQQSASFAEQLVSKRLLNEQLTRLFGDEAKQPHACVSVQHGAVSAQSNVCGGLPDPLAFISASSVGSAAAQLLAERLSALGVRSLVTPTHSESRAAFSFLATRISKYCDVHSHAPPPIRVALVGGDAHVNGALRSFVEHFAAKPPTWLRYVLFFIVPFGHAQSNLARYLATIDRTYAAYFAEPFCLQRDDQNATSLASSAAADADLAARRIRDYLASASAVVNLAIGEVQITAASTGKLARTEDDSVFVPFVSDVRVGTDLSQQPIHGTVESADEQLPATSVPATSSPAGTISANSAASQPIGIAQVADKQASGILSHSPPGTGTVTVTPPNSPAAAALSNPKFGTGVVPLTPTVGGDQSSNSVEYFELQIDTWLLPGRSRPDDKDAEKEKDREKDKDKDKDSRDGPSAKRDDERDRKEKGEKEKDKEKRKGDAAKQCCLKCLFRAVYVTRLPSLVQLHAVSSAFGGFATPSASCAQVVHAAAPALLGFAGLLSSPPQPPPGVASSVSLVQPLSGNGLSPAHAHLLPLTLPSSPSPTTTSGLGGMQHQQQLAELMSTLTLSYTTREKKQKMTMRIVKKTPKEKDDAARSQMLDGVTRLVCSAPSRGDKMPTLTIFVDGVEHAAVKFFQLSSHWQSHVKYFPVACFITPSTSALPPLANSL